MTLTQVTHPSIGDELAKHFGADPTAFAIVSGEYHRWDQINLQMALNTYLDQDSVTAEVLGIATSPSDIPHYLRVPTLEKLIVDHRVKRATRPSTVERAAGPDDVMECIEVGLILLTGPLGPMALWVHPARQPYPIYHYVDVMAATPEAAQAMLDALHSDMQARNLFRGHVLNVDKNMFGQTTIDFVRRPQIQSDDIILPDRTLRAIEQHAFAISDNAQALTRAGRHLKRGILLYGPPGTGKSLVIRYLASRLSDTTVFMLSGAKLGAVTDAVEMSQFLGSTMIALDDVDLIAEDRNLGGMSPRRHLFDLLNAMDGVAERSDLLFVCTTNRPENLERAFSSRPGRIDQAIAVGLPEGRDRQGLFELYSAGVTLDITEMGTIIDRTAGVTASFMRELVRKSTVAALTEGGEGTNDSEITVADHHVHAALDTLLGATGTSTPKGQIK